MSKFVNFKKRGITLPDGCKNLVDLLRLPVVEAEPNIAGWPNNSSRPSPRIMEIPVGNLPDVVRYLFQPGARARSAIICTPGEREIIGLGWNKTRSALTGNICFPDRPEIIPKARTFIESLGKVSSPPNSTDLQAADLRWDDLLNYELFADSELELNTLLRRFFNEFLNTRPDIMLTCMISRPRADDESWSGAVKN